MSIYNYEKAFGAWDKTSPAMRRAIERWFALYYGQDSSREADGCQRVAYSAVNKLVKTLFGEYRAEATLPLGTQLLQELEDVQKQALQLALVGGECYMKPCPTKAGFSVALIPRDRVLIFGRDDKGVPTDVGLSQIRMEGNDYYTLLERRTVDADGYLTIRNRLFRSRDKGMLGTEIPLANVPFYSNLAAEYRYEKPVGSVGLVQVKTPMLNCVDGSADGVAVFAAAEGVIANIDKNEAQMNGEFSRGQSRVFASSDLLDKEQGLKDTLFVGLDEDPERVGLTVYSPQLRHEAYLARKQEYLRNAESIMGLQRGMLSDANMDDRTATEITASAAEFSLTVIQFQQMWQQAVQKLFALCALLAQLYDLPSADPGELSIDWGNGTLYDQEKTWAEYVEMVDKGLLKPEIALSWWFHIPCQTEDDLEQVRKTYMPS